MLCQTIKKGKVEIERTTKIRKSENADEQEKYNEEVNNLLHNLE